MAQSSTGLSSAYHIAPSVSDVSLITLSRPRIPLPAVFQGSVLGPLFFDHEHYPVSTLISFLSLNRHLYADDTQLFFLILAA